MRTKVVSAWLVLCIILLTACGGGGGGSSSDVAAVTETITGIVVDSSGIPVPGADIKITSDPVNTQTDANGMFSYRYSRVLTT